MVTLHSPKDGFYRPAAGTTGFTLPEKIVDERREIAAGSRFFPKGVEADASPIQIVPLPGTHDYAPSVDAVISIAGGALDVHGARCLPQLAKWVNR